MCVSWEDAQAFCKKLGDGFRLPTEAQWEYACRAGTTTVYSFGDDASRLDEYAWYEGNADSKDEKYAHVVGKKKPNPWGLYDMHGNVWEWCEDSYDEDYYEGSPASDPHNTSTGAYRVLRGGGWLDYAYYCRSAIRGRGGPCITGSNIGFRVARSPSAR